MKPYRVAVYRQGAHIATHSTNATSSTLAISQTERELNLLPKAVAMATNGQVQTVQWSGFEFVARLAS